MLACLIGVSTVQSANVNFDFSGNAVKLQTGSDSNTGGTIGSATAPGGASFSLSNPGDLRFELAPEGLGQPAMAAYLGTVAPSGSGFGENVVYVNVKGFSLFDDANAKLLAGEGICAPCQSPFCADHNVTCTTASLLILEGIPTNQPAINFDSCTEVAKNGTTTNCAVSGSPLEVYGLQGDLVYWGARVAKYVFTDGSDNEVALPGFFFANGTGTAVRLPSGTVNILADYLSLNVNFFFSSSDDSVIPGNFSRGCVSPVNTIIGTSITDVNDASECAPLSVPKNDLKYMLSIKESVWDLPSQMPTPPGTTASRLCFETVLSLVDATLTVQGNAVMYFNDDKAKTTVTEWESVTAIAWKDSGSGSTVGGVALIDRYDANGVVRAVQNFVSNSVLRMCVEKADFGTLATIRIDPTVYTTEDPWASDTNDSSATIHINFAAGALATIAYLLT